MSMTPHEVSSSLRPVPTPSTSRPASHKVSGEQLDRLIGRIFTEGSRHTAPVMAPYTNSAIREVPLCSADDVQEAVRRARIAHKEWAKRSFAERARVFLRFHDMVLARQDEVLDLIQMENGKARKHAFEEVADTAITSRYYAHHAEQHLSPQRRMGALPGLTTTWEHHHPLGVVGIISPWNYPLTLAMADAIPALMAGCAVVIKPDQQTPFSCLWAARLLDEAGLPPNLLMVVTGRGRDLGSPLIQAVDYINFTGSTPTGRIIARQAGERLIGCSLELGGKNPMIVLDDADVEKASEGAIRACFSNTGQLCISIERVYVHSSIFDRFLSRFGERTRALKLGASFDYEVDIGSMSSQDQLEKTEEHVRDAVSKGATVVAGGRARPDIGPLFYEPTILTNVPKEAAVFREETFGPLASVYRFESIEEAVTLANDTRYGLNASVWTGDVKFGMELGTRLESGTVNVNEGYAAAWASVDSPMGGFKDSGLGRRHGAQGILKYTEAQTVAAQHLMPLAAPQGVSERRYSEVMSGALKILKRIPGVR